jgi:hypothetical protein
MYVCNYVFVKKGNKVKEDNNNNNNNTIPYVFVFMCLMYVCM